MYVTVMTKGRVEGTWERWEREGTWKGREYYLILFQLKIYLGGGEPFLTKKDAKRLIIS